MNANRTRKCVFLSAVVGIIVSASVAKAFGQTSQDSIAEWQQAVVGGSAEALVELALAFGQDPVNADEQRAFDLLLIAANRFNQPMAQVNLGVLYQFGGGGVEADLSRAAYWYDRAVQSGNPAAQAKLADLYSRGMGTAVDFNKAAALYMKSAGSGFADAQLEMGYIYEMGDLGEIDYKAAMGFYQQAAEQGNEIAQYNLAEMYELGKGVTVDVEQARKWYGMSADNGLQEAQEALDRLQ